MKYKDYREIPNNVIVKIDLDTGYTLAITIKNKKEIQFLEFYSSDSELKLKNWSHEFNSGRSVVNNALSISLYKENADDYTRNNPEMFL